jgi:signal transduction histidine kinase
MPCAEKVSFLIPRLLFWKKEYRHRMSRRDAKLEKEPEEGKRIHSGESATMSREKEPEPGPGPAREEEDGATALAGIFSDFGTESGDRDRMAGIVDLLPCYTALIGRDYRIRFYNRAFEQFFGPPGDKPCYLVMRGQEKACRFCPPLDCLGTGRTSVMEWVHPGSDHAFRVYTYPFTDQGVPCVLEAGFNITASMRVRQALDLSKQSYRAITDNLSIGIALVDPELRIKTGNIRLSQWFAEGFRLDRRVCDLLQCGESWALETAEGCADCPFKAALADGASHEKELAVAFEDGKERILRLVTCPVKPGRPASRKPKVRALIMMLEDITNRLRVNQQLQRARKLEAMSTLAGGIAHEINQPLSALHLYASGLQMLLEKPGALPLETTQERLSLIMQEADKIRGIISHMRALVMQEGRVPLAAVSLAAAVNNVLVIMRHQTGVRDVAIHLDVPEKLPLVRSNALQLEQVLINLLTNALHALDAGNPEHEHGRDRVILVRASVLQENDRVRLEVADSGPGLPPGSERIFDPFYTTKERHVGMGLGLSIVHGLVSLWGGEISAVPHHAQLGGAAFFVDFHQAGPEDFSSADARARPEDPSLREPASPEGAFPPRAGGARALPGEGRQPGGGQEEEEV